MSILDTVLVPGVKPQTTVSSNAVQGPMSTQEQSQDIQGPALPPVQPEKSSIISTNDIHKEAKSNSALLDSFLKYGTATPNMVDKNTTGKEVTVNDTTDPYMKMLTDMANRSGESTKRLIASIGANKAKRENEIKTSADRYASGLQLLGIQTNRAQSTPDILAGQIKQAENEKLAKLSELDAEETKALMDAEDARANNDFKFLKERMDYVKQINQEKKQALKDYNDTILNSSKMAEAQIDPQLATEIVKGLNGIADPIKKEEYINAISTKFGIHPYALVPALQGVITNKTKEDLAIANARRLAAGGGGISESDKVNEIRNALKTGVISGTKAGNPRGADGFYDPYLVLDVFNQLDYTPEEFVSKFKLKGTINQASKKLFPKNLQDLLFETRKA